MESKSNSNSHSDPPVNNARTSSQHWSNFDHSTFSQQPSTSTAYQSNKSLQLQSSTPPKAQNDFRPEDNLVIDIKKESATFLNFNQDNIRRTLSQTFGPIIIEEINRYNFKSDKPKIMIQLSNKKERTNIINRWNQELFGGSSIREAIDLKSLTTNTGMLKGVPLDANDNSFVNDICSIYPDAEPQRLFYKEGKHRNILKMQSIQECACSPKM